EAERGGEEGGEREGGGGRSGGADDLEGRRQLADETDDGDDDLERCRDDEQAAGPGLQQQIARRHSRLGHGREYRERGRAAPAGGRPFRCSWTGHNALKIE